jgi:hypothetical protein
MNKIENQVNYWLVVRNVDTGDILNAKSKEGRNLTVEKVIERFIENNPLYQVLHIGIGDLPPKVYQSLGYIDNLSANAIIN